MICAGAAGAVLAGARALVGAHALALAVQVSPGDLAALDAARAEAAREYTTTTAAVAAYKRVERLREPLLTSGDSRAALWYADAAEDALLIGMNADGAGVNALVGIATPDELARTRAILQQALQWTQRGDECARAELAEGTASPALAARLENTERTLRIPLLRSMAAVWAARCGALAAEDTKPVLELALNRLQSIAQNLQGPARTLDQLASAAALIQLGRLDEAARALDPIVASAQTEPGARVMAMALLAEASGRSAADQRRALATVRSRNASTLDDNARLLLGDVDFRLAGGTASGAGATPAWQGWLDALAAATPSRKSMVRQSVLERLARHAAAAEQPVPALARALLRLRSAETREAAVEQVSAAVGDASIPAELRIVAELELGRAELELGRARDGAVRLLRFAQEHSADPASRTAIDVAVVAARSIGDPALLATVLGTAVERFPDHPDHAAWRIQATALALSPDATLLVQREPAPRRLARAMEALDRAERTATTDTALRADLTVAAAEAANEMRNPTDALKVLDRLRDPRAGAGEGGGAGSPPAGGTGGGTGGGMPLLPGIPADLRVRMLEERIAALAIAQRVVDADEWVAMERQRDAAATADACARVLRRQIPVDLASGLIDPPAADLRSRLAQLASATLTMAPTSPERDEIVACAYLMGGLPDLALPVARRLEQSRPDRADTVLALAECIYATGEPAALAESMRLHTRLSQSCAEGTPTWWIAELRRLQTLDRVNRNVEVIAPRIARLQAAHPDLGGPALRALFLALAARHERGVTASATKAGAE